MKRTGVLGIFIGSLAVGLLGCSSMNIEGYANPTTINTVDNQQSHKAEDISDKEAIDFLQKAYQAQMSLKDSAIEETQTPNGEIKTVYHPLSHEEIQKTLKSYQTEASITTFIQEAGETTEEGWLPHEEDITGYLVDYKKDAKQITFKRANGQIEVTALVYVEEQSPAKVIATLSNTDKGWRISQIANQ